MKQFRMVDIAHKLVQKRTAIASGKVFFSHEGYTKLVTNGSDKGDVFLAAQIVGIQAAKITPQILPFCHPLEITSTQIDTEINHETKSI